MTEFLFLNTADFGEDDYRRFSPSAAGSGGKRSCVSGRRRISGCRSLRKARCGFLSGGGSLSLPKRSPLQRKRAGSPICLAAP